MSAALGFRFIAIVLAATIFTGCYSWVPIANWQAESESATVRFGRARVGSGRATLEFEQAEMTDSVVSGNDRTGARIIADARDHDDIVVRRPNWGAISAISAGATVSAVATGFVLIVLAILASSESGTPIRTGGVTHPTDL